MISIFIQIVLFSFCFSATGCTLFKKDSGGDEMQTMTESVLKHHEGIEIDFKPIPEQKK
jgi:hypothetical protein